MNASEIEVSGEAPGIDYKIDLGCSALNAFFKIAKDWDCTPDEQGHLLGSIGVIKLEGYRRDREQPLDKKSLIRISSLVMIYKATIRRHGGVSGSKELMCSPLNKAPFNGLSPINHILRYKFIGLMEACKFFVGKLPRQIE